MTMTTARRNGAPPRPSPAHNEDAEQAVLGSAMRDPEALAWLATHLDPFDFYSKAHQQLAALLVELYTDGVSVTPGVMLATLAERGALQDLGGAPYLHSLDAAAETAANVGWFGRKVKAAARQREALDLATGVLQAVAEGWEAERVAALAVGEFQRLLDDDGGADVGGVPELLQSLREVRDRRLANRRVSWGLANLDAITGGLEPGTVTILAARPAVGKSGLALQITAHIAEHARTLFVSYEMGRSQIARRQLARIAEVPTDAALMRVDDPRLGAARVTYEALDFTFIDAADLELERMLAKVRALHARRPFRLIAVDYAQLIPVQAGRYKNREQEVAAISRALRRLARRMDVPVLELAQLNRGADGQRPTLATLRESGQLEADGDVVVLLHDPDDGSGSVEAHVAKHRDGPTGWTLLRFDRPLATFSDDPRGLQC
jgi:replicative DNA helicase